jgi:hypothetical protein
MSHTACMLSIRATSAAGRGNLHVTQRACEINESGLIRQVRDGVMPRLAAAGNARALDSDCAGIRASVKSVRAHAVVAANSTLAPRFLL